MLPGLYTLYDIEVVGHLRNPMPASINCRECGQRVCHYDDVHLVLDHKPECGLVAAEDAYFASEWLLERLAAMGAKGYVHHPVAISLSDDFRRWHLEADLATYRVPRYQYFAITGRCDGPWVQYTEGGQCPLCGRVRPHMNDTEAWMSNLLAGLPPKRRLVYTDTWHGEDFFWLSEPGPPLITNRVAAILDSIGNLHQMQAEPTQEMTCYQVLTSEGPLVHRCGSLGPAGWVERSQTDPSLG